MALYPALVSIAWDYTLSVYFFESISGRFDLDIWFNPRQGKNKRNEVRAHLQRALGTFEYNIFETRNYVARIDCVSTSTFLLSSEHQPTHMSGAKHHSKGSLIWLTKIDHAHVYDLLFDLNGKRALCSIIR